MRKYILILLTVLILSGCQANTVTYPDTSDTTVQTEETGSETETTETQTEETAAEAGTEDTDTTLPETEEDDSESETTTSDTSEETEAEAELPPGVICYSQQLYVDADPPYIYTEADIDLPDFLTEEQKILYQQAETVFPLFNGSPYMADFIVLHEGESSGTRRIVETENGYSYYSVEGKYQKWDDFKSMVLNVFTEEYFQELNHIRDYNGTDIEVFIEKGGDTYGFGVDRIPLGIAPTTFELQSMTDEEIRFTATYRYEPRDDPEWSEKETVYRTAEIILQNTENGWRFTKYNCAGWYRRDPLEY